MKILTAASAASLALVSGALAGTTASEITVSSAGSTALKNWIVANTQTVTEAQPVVTDPTNANNPVLANGQLTIGGTTYPNPVLYPTTANGGSSYWASNSQAVGATGQSYQLAPKVYIAGGGSNGDPTNGATDAIRFEYHESGSVEGIYELANDQIYTNTSLANSIAYVTKNVDRNPDSGNAVWVNYNQIGASGTTNGAAWDRTAGASVNGYTLGNMYATGVGQGNGWTSGSASNPLPTFNQAGVNANNGQNAVQFALSDAVPQQVFANDYGNTSNTYTPVGGAPTTNTGVAMAAYNSNPLDQGYGSGNTKLSTGTLGTAGSRAVYQSAGVLNMPATAINPRTGAAFGVGAWNNATDGGLGNLNTQLGAITATLFVANPGTGLTQVNRTDADFLEISSRFQNGAGFNMTTRDVNSGTRDVAALDTGVDPSYASGKNDDGNGNLTNGVTNATFDQRTIGPAMRFSNKTAGGAQLRPTVQNNRMAVGTLSINDANSKAFNTSTVDSPIRALNYMDGTTANPNPNGYVQAGYTSISNGTYAIYQNEQFVTLRNPDANYATNTVTTTPVVTYGTGANSIVTGGVQVINGTILGDDANNDVRTLLNNAASSLANSGAAILAGNPADGLISQGYLVPQLMQVKKNLDGQGLDNTVLDANGVDTGTVLSQSNTVANGGNYDPNFANSYIASGLTSKISVDNPSTVTIGNGSKYGDQGATTVVQNYYNGAAIPITMNNYIFGNFNQNGTRDYNAAVKSGLAADRALIAADQAVGASVPGSEFTSLGDNNGVAGGTNGVVNSTLISYTDALGTVHNNLTKGDLIVMGDFLGSGHFDGASLVAIADNAALADSAGGDRLSAKTYSTGVLVKNAAMDYLDTNVAQVGSGGANAVDTYIRQSGRAILEAASVPLGASPVLSPITSAQVVDPVSGLDEFSYDPNGVNTFNKADVNRDGAIDFNDAVVVDNANGLDYTNLANQAGATQLAPVSGASVLLNLPMAKLSDTSTVIDSTDVAVVNTQLTGSGTTNWYGYNLQKTGPSTITYARSGGAVNVYPNATFQISGGSVVVGTGSIDPFSGTGGTAGNHVAVTVDHGAKLQYATNSAVGSTLAGLTVDVASGSQVDLSNNHIFIDYGANDPITTIASYIKSGYNGGAWNGPGIMSTTAQTSANGLFYGVGYADGADHVVVGLSSGQIEVAYTLLGDANLDGLVNTSDFNIVAANFNQSITGWDQGDFNYDGLVNTADFNELAANFNQGVSGANSAGDVVALDAFAAANGLSLPTSSVPEPASASVLIAAGLGFLSRRRRK